MVHYFGADDVCIGNKRSYGLAIVFLVLFAPISSGAFIYAQF